MIFDLNGVIIQRQWPVAEESMIGLVKSLRSHGLKTAVLSNLTRAAAAEVRNLDWAQEFDELGFSGELGVSKSSPDSFLYVAQKLDVDPARCLFVDDTRYNLHAAHDAGMTTHEFVNQAGLVRELRELRILDE